MSMWKITAAVLTAGFLLVGVAHAIAQDAAPPAKTSTNAVPPAKAPPATSQPAKPSQPAGDGVTSRPATDDNPPAEGFDVKGSDEKAIAIADTLMERMGGRQAWDDTRYIEWGFFGRRFYLWDKHTGDVRIRFPHQNENLVVLMNLNTKTGRVWQHRKEITNEHALKDFLDKAYEAWINDSYWLVMPFKLKDSGVTLKYLGEFKTQRDKMADVVRLSFKRVGVTPDNVYHVYVGKESGLIEQWDWFRNFYDDAPTFQMPWLGYRRYGNIVLSADRGEGRTLSDVSVFDEVDRDLFTKPEPFDRRVTMPARRPTG